MLLKIISFFLLFFSFLFAEIKIYANEANEVNNTIYLKKPLIIYKDFFVQANKGIIKNKKIRLEGSVVVFYQNTSYLATSADIITKDNIVVRDIFLIDRSIDIWIKAKLSKIKKDKISLNNVIFSSCCIEKPDWFLYSSKGAYNKKTKYLRLYNIRLYVHNVPVFYFPFFFNSLDKKRRSGLLRPYIGYSAKEGFLYSQPIYLVLGERSDFEITPTIRTIRGRGVYNTFKFVTSPYSYGEIKFGEFVDFDKYYKKYNLANKKHYGYQIYYKVDKISKNDKLYMNLKYANDVDYFYLNPYNYTFNTKYLVDKLITSKLNYIKNFKTNYFFGMYAKYFIDTTKVSNDDTIQILPELNIHKFETKNFLLNSFDLNIYNFTSKSLKYYQLDFNMPLSINWKLFDDYLNIKLSENFDYITANNYNSKKKPEYFYQVYSSLKLYSSLTKKRDYIHIVNPSITFNIKQISKSSEENNLLNYTTINNSISLSIFQIYEKSDFYIDHDLKQNIALNLKNNGSLENIINIKKSVFSFSDINKYDWDINRVSYNSATFHFPIKAYKFKLSHIYSYPKDSGISQAYTIRVEKLLNKYKKIYFEYNYDIENKYMKYLLIGAKLNKRCWQYDFNIKKDRLPVLKDDGISYYNNYMLTFNINFYPIGGVKQTIQLK